ncbi:hypothetical protein MBLNU459_g7284t1 [Dothideomycetes sp. NU459]
MALSLIISDLSPFTLNDAEDLTGWLHLHLNVPDPEVSLIAEFYLRIVCHDQMASKASSSESRASIRHLLNRDHLDMALETFDVQLAPSERWNSSPLDTLKPLIARDNALTISEPDIVSIQKWREGAIRISFCRLPVADSAVARGIWLDGEHYRCKPVDDLDRGMFWCHKCFSFLCIIDGGCGRATPICRFCEGPHNSNSCVDRDGVVTQCKGCKSLRSRVAFNHVAWDPDHFLNAWHKRPTHPQTNASLKRKSISPATTPVQPTRRKLLSTAYTTPSKKRDITVAPSEPEPITSNTSFEPEPNTYMASSEPEPNKSVPLCEPKPNTFVTSFESDSNAFMAPFGPDLNTFMAPFEPAPKTFMAPFEPEPNTSMTSSEPESNTFMAPFEPELNTFMTPFEPEPDTSMASFGSESTISCDTPTRPPSSRSLSLSWESLTTGPWSEVGMSVGPSDTVPVLCQPSASFCGSYLQPHGDVSITHIADTLHTTDPASVGLAAWDVVWDNDAWDSEFPMNLSSSIPDHHVSKTTDVCDDFSAGSSIDVTTSLEDLSTISDHHHSEDETTAVTSHVNNHF